MTKYGIPPLEHILIFSLSYLVHAEGCSVGRDQVEVGVRLLLVEIRDATEEVGQVQLRRREVVRELGPVHERHGEGDEGFNTL
jgi:hypothetical protein